MLRYAALLLVLLTVMAPSPGAMGGGQTQSRRVIEMTAERFEFWPSEVKLSEGEEVEFRIRSADTMHGFRIVGTGTNLVVPKRGKGQAVATFIASAPGRYTIECNRMCGAGHNFMRASIVVRPTAGGSGR